MKKAFIVSGGDFSSPDISLDFDYIIACDKGYQYTQQLNIIPDVIIGDFDSYEGSLNTDIQVIRHPVEKDDTDTMLAIKYAFNHGYNHIVIICALGGRIDHELANIQSMAYVATNGGKCEIYSDKEHLMTLTNASVSIPRKEGYSLSVLSLTDKSEGVTIEGAKYSANDISLSNNFPLGFGNSWKEDIVTISVKRGSLVIIQSKMPEA